MDKGDRAIVANLRQRWAAQLDGFTDQDLADEYRHFSMSDYYGNNDERFLEWLQVS